MNAVATEWTKLWTTRTVWWALIAAVVLMLAGSGQYAIFADNGDLDPELLTDGRVSAGTIAVLATSIAQLAFLALAMLVMTSEYSAGTMRATLAWIPSRGRLLLAKCAVVAAVTFVAGTVAALLGALVALPLLGDLGTTDGIAGRSLAVGVYLTLLAVLATGLGAALRGPVITLVVLLMLLVVVPPILLTPDVAVLTTIAESMPGVAGDDFLHGDLSGLPVLVAWAVAAALLGWRVLRRRDA